MSIISFENYYCIGKSFKIEIDQINFLKDEKLFVSVGGEMCSDKIYLINKYVQLPLVDEKKLSENFITNESFIHMGLNKDLVETRNRLQKAKENNFTTILVLIDTNFQEKTSDYQYESKQVFKKLIKDNNIVDFYVNHKI